MSNLNTYRMRKIEELMTELRCFISNTEIHLVQKKERTSITKI